MHDQCIRQPKRWWRWCQALWRPWNIHRFCALIGLPLINERAQGQHLRLNPPTSGRWLSAKTQGLALAFYGDAPEQFMQTSGTGNPTHEASMLRPVQASSGEGPRQLITRLIAESTIGLCDKMNTQRNRDLADSVVSNHLLEGDFLLITSQPMLKA